MQLQEVQAAAVLPVEPAAVRQVLAVKVTREAQVVLVFHLIQPAAEAALVR
jgi:hypothetical protein